MESDEKKRHRTILLAAERVKCEVFSLEQGPALKEISFEQALEILAAEKKLDPVCQELISSLTKNYNSEALDIVVTRVHTQLRQK